MVIIRKIIPDWYSKKPYLCANFTFIFYLYYYLYYPRMKLHHLLLLISLGASITSCDKTPKKDETKTDEVTTTSTESTTTTLPETSTEPTPSTETPSTPATSEPTVIPKVTTAEKIGYLNSQELLSIIPEAQAAERKLQEMFKGKEAQYASLARTAQEKLQRYQETGAKLNEDERKNREDELMGLDKQLQDLQAGTQTELEKERERVMGPLLKKLDKTVAQVAKENGFTYVLDPSITGMVYADSTRNILPLVKAKLGLKGKKK
jgi:outer membrane protein